MSRRSEELELKYLIGDADSAAAAIDSLFPLPPDEVWRRFRITDRYFDTADKALARAGYGARLRRIGGHTLLTLKSDIEVEGGRHRRLELEAPAGSSLRRPSRWPPSEARDQLLDLVGDRRLIESFRVRQTRRERAISFGRARVALSIDAGVVESIGVPVGEICQLEAELLSGPESGLTRVAARLDAAGTGRPESRSKLVMAADLVAQAGRLRLEDDFAEAGRKVLRRHLLRMLEREIALRQDDSEALRQMRVATRRMRAAWRVFGAAFRKREERRYVAELRRVAGALGEVRDMDVLLAALPTSRALAPLADAWRQRRDAAREQLDRLLAGREYATFVDDYLAFTGERGAGIAKRRKTSVGAQVDGRIGLAEDRLALATGAATAAADDAAWHALRIAVKRLRYTIESLGDVLDADAAAARIADLRHLQDRLGEMNDAAVAAREAQAWLDGAGAASAPSTQAAVRRFVDATRRHAIDIRAHFDIR